jgi:nucleoside-diphosphate-sugar epimerase
MKIFLTGGTGFIGSYILREALSRGHDVVALRTRLSSRTIIPVAQDHQWLDKDLCELTPNDLSDCEVVIHTASTGVPPKKVAWPELVRVNVTGSATLINITRESGINRIIVAGTYQEYGKAFFKYLDDLSKAPLNPYSLYGASKASAYYLLSSYAELYNMELYYPRLTHVYGIGAPDQSFWCALRSAALQGADFKMSAGTQIVDYVSVEQVARTLVDGCARKISNGEPLVELIGSGQVQTLLDFAKHEWERMGALGRLLPGELSSS